MASISSLTSADRLNTLDLLEVSVVNALMESGFESNKVTVDDLAKFIVNSIMYSSALNTTNKTITGAINEVLSQVGGGLELTDTLEAGQTSITFTDEGILTTATYDFYTSLWGVNPKEVTVINGQLTLTFDVQQNDIVVKVVVK